MERSLTFENDPAALPADSLVDDWFVLHYHHDPESFPRWLVELLVGLRHALGTVDAGTGELLDDIAAGSVAAADYPSLVSLGEKEQLAAVVLATVAVSPGFGADWEQVARLAYGGEKTVEQTALLLNQANGSPLTDDDLLAQPFRDGGLVYRMARAYDRLSGCRRRSCRAGPDTAIESPVAQLLVAFRAGIEARDGRPGHQGCSRPWRIEDDGELASLMYLLGDHEPPGVPAVVPPPSPTVNW